MKELERNDKDERTLFKEIHELEFAAVDLNLYLDNFPDNKEALAAYNTITANLRRLKAEYEMKCGVITNFGCMESKYPFSYALEPWPWEIGE